MLARPPGRPDASSTVTSQQPERCSSSAAASPAKPAPMTATRGRAAAALIAVAAVAAARRGTTAALKGAAIHTKRPLPCRARPQLSVGKEAAGEQWSCRSGPRRNGNDDQRIGWDDIVLMNGAQCGAADLWSGQCKARRRRPAEAQHSSPWAACKWVFSPADAILTFAQLRKRPASPSSPCSREQGSGARYGRQRGGAGASLSARGTSVRHPSSRRRRRVSPLAPSTLGWPLSWATPGLWHHEFTAADAHPAPDRAASASATASASTQLAAAAASAGATRCLQSCNSAPLLPPCAGFPHCASSAGGSAAWWMAHCRPALRCTWPAIWEAGWAAAPSTARSSTSKQQRHACWHGAQASLFCRMLSTSCCHACLPQLNVPLPHILARSSLQTASPHWSWILMPTVACLRHACWRASRCRCCAPRHCRMWKPSTWLCSTRCHACGSCR